MNFIITKNQKYYENIGNYKYLKLSELNLPDKIAIDTETTGLSSMDDKLFCVQIGTGINNYIIDLTKDSGYVFEELIPYLKGRELVFHNASFDLGFFYKYDFFPEKVRDTLLASMLLYNGYPKFYRHGFAFCMERELGLNYDKSVQKNISTIKLSTAKSIQYCFNDVDKLLLLEETLASKLEMGGSKETYDLHCRYVKALTYMEQCGLPLSQDKWVKKMEIDNNNLIDIKDKIIDYIFYKIPIFRDTQINMFSEEKKLLLNFQSPKQMIPVFEHFKINVMDNSKPPKKSITEDVLKKTKHEFVDMWLIYKGLQHSMNNFGQNILDKMIEGRIYTRFKPILDTARISTRRGQINFLNFPANEATRSSFVAKDGWSMIVCDYVGQENVTGADLHKDPVMVNSINDGLDLHCAFARMIFPELLELTDDEIENSHKSKRDFSKAPRFAFAYGGTGYTVASNINVPIEEGNRLEALFKELHSGVYEWGAKVFEEAMKVGYIQSAGGFKLHLDYFEKFKEEEREVSSQSKEFWNMYKEGKILTLKRRKKEEEDKIIRKPITRAEEHYIKWRPKVSWVASKRSSYYRLCLNNPIQTTSAHQTKLAACILFEEILKNGNVWDVKICNIPHDEIVLESKNELCLQYKHILENSMIEAGNFYLNSGLVKMKAEAKIGGDWNEAK